MIAYIFNSFYILISSLVFVSACNKYLPNQINSEQFKNLLTIFIVMLHRTEHTVCMTVDMSVFLINKIKVGLYFKIRENKLNVKIVYVQIKCLTSDK